MSAPENPYATPSAPLGTSPTAPVAQAEHVRNHHLTHEASVRSIGILYYLGAFGGLLGGVALLAAAVLVPDELASDPESPGTGGVLVMGAFFIGLGIVQFVVGRGVRKLQSWVKLPVGLLSVLGLFGFPLGTLINLYILYLVFSKKGSVVLSPEYQQVIAQTPHVKYRTSVLVWILLAIILALVAFAVIAAITA